MKPIKIQRGHFDQVELDLSRLRNLQENVLLGKLSALDVQDLDAILSAICTSQLTTQTNNTVKTKEPKLYHKTSRTTYHVFSITGGGRVIKIDGPDDEGYMCVSDSDWEDTIDLLKQGQDGDVCIHAGLFYLAGLISSESYES